MPTRAPGSSVSRHAKPGSRNQMRAGAASRVLASTMRPSREADVEVVGPAVVEDDLRLQYRRRRQPRHPAVEGQGDALRRRLHDGADAGQRHQRVTAVDEIAPRHGAPVLVVVVAGQERAVRGGAFPDGSARLWAGRRGSRLRRPEGARGPRDPNHGRPTRPAVSAAPMAATNHECRARWGDLNRTPGGYCNCAAAKSPGKRGRDMESDASHVRGRRGRPSSGGEA